MQNLLVGYASTNNGKLCKISLDSRTFVLYNNVIVKVKVTQPKTIMLSKLPHFVIRIHKIICYCMGIPNPTNVVY